MANRHEITAELATINNTLADIVDAYSFVDAYVVKTPKDTEMLYHQMGVKGVNNLIYERLEELSNNVNKLFCKLEEED